MTYRLNNKHSRTSSVDNTLICNLELLVDLLRQQSMVSNSLSLPTFGIVNLFHFRHSGGCVVLSHCGFNLNMHISISKVIYIYIENFISTRKK